MAGIDRDAEIRFLGHLITDLSRQQQIAFDLLTDLASDRRLECYQQRRAALIAHVRCIYPALCDCKPPPATETGNG